MNPEEIKEVSVKYCKEVLAKNKPTLSFEDIAKLKERLHEGRMKESCLQGFMVDKDTFDNVVNKFKRNNKRN